MEYPDAVTTAQRVRDGMASAVELVDEAFAAIDTPTHERLNAFVFVDQERARAAAETIDRARAAGEPLGPMAGVPFGVKELQQVDGWPDTAGSVAFADRVADQTDTMTRRLINAGAVPIGLTASPELGRSSFCSTALHGTTRNPWDSDRTPGGSSSGSAAAVSAGITTFCTGSDGAGSLRIPASFSGVVGFKPTTGTVPRGPKFVGTAGNGAYGVLTTTVRDTAVLMDCIAGVEDAELGTVVTPHRFHESLDALPSGLRVGYGGGLGYSPLDPHVRAATESACNELVTAIDGTRVELDGKIALTDAGAAFRALSMLDVWDQVRELPEDRMALLDYSVRQYSEHVAHATFDDYLDAHHTRTELTRDVAAVFDLVDVLVLPATPVVAFGAEGPMPREIDGEEVDHWGSLRLTYPFNLTGHPAISVPVPDVEGLPIGLQIVARRFADPLVLQVAARFEAAYPWQRHSPVTGSAP